MTRLHTEVSKSGAVRFFDLTWTKSEQSPQSVQGKKLIRKRGAVPTCPNVQHIYLLVFGLAFASLAIGQEVDIPMPADPPAADPQILRDLLRNLVNPRANGNRRRNMRPNVPGRSDNDENSSGTRDPIDSRAPRDPKVEQLLKAADIAIRQKNWKSAVDLYQRLLDQPEDSLHRSENGEWLSIRRTAIRMLGKLPEATLAEYRSQYGGLAQQQLNAARQSGLTTDYVNVATRFFHTPAGYEAAHYLGARHFDRSEFGLAAKWFEELSTSQAAIARNDSWLLQAAYAATRAGDSKLATAMLDRLSKGGSTNVSIGTGVVRAADWLKSSQGESSAVAVALSNWTQFYGTAARVGTAIGGDALLSPNWFLPLTSSHSVQNSLKWLIHDLQDQQRAMILAAVPLVIDGKVIYRDLRGMRSVDIENGRVLWESVEGVSPERILGGIPNQQIDMQDAWRFQVNQFQFSNDYQGISAEYSPLASLLFRDGTYGLISSDGRQVFVIEDHGILSRNQPGQHWGWDGNADFQDPFGVPWKTNRLVSYDIETGRAVWSAGGIESKESFDLPLAGSYIYGAPSIEGSELFIVAGKGDEIRLWSLDRRTGTPNWSQLIAYSDTKIDLDIARRWITSQVAVGGGIIVCPTTVGWLVAVDRMRQSVLWAHRYTPRIAPEILEREAGSQFLQQQELNASWGPSAPVISGGFVVYTPQEQARIICINAVDGRQIWEQPKQRGLYLAGVFDEKVIIVAESGVTALRLSDGQSLWTTNIDEGTRPSGRGIAVENRYYLPLSNGELQSISLTDGSVLSQTFVGTHQPPLGNLAMHHGKLVSLSPTGVTAFGQRHAVFEEIERRLAKDPDDAWALLRSSEIHILNHQFAAALKLLQRTSRDQLSAEELERHHVSLVECLSTIVRSDIIHRANELEALKVIAATPAEILQYHELTAEKLLAENQPLQAFEIFAKLAEEDGDAFVARTDDRRISAKRTVWLCGRMSEIWSATPETDQPSITRRIETLTQEASRRNAVSCQRIATLFAFHPAAIKAKQRFVDWLIAANDLAGARIILQQLAEHEDRTVAANAIERLARVMTQSQLPSDEVYYYRKLESQFGDVIVRDDLTGAAITAEVRAKNDLSFEPKIRGVTWSETPLQLEQSMVPTVQNSQEVTHETSLPFFDHLSLESYPNEQRIALESAATGQVDWMIPLRAAVRGNDEGYITTSHLGHQIFMVNRGILHAISPIEKRILWSKSLEDQADGSFQGRHASRPTLSSMIEPGSEENSQSLLMQQAFVTGNLAVVEANYLCVYGHRSLSILDPRTGSELWKLEGLPSNAQLIGNRDALFVIVPGKNEAQVYRALDGKPLNVPNVAKLLNSALLTHGSSLLIYEFDGTPSPSILRTKRSRSSKSKIKLYDPVANVTHWEISFAAGTQVSPISRDEIVAVQPDGQVQKIDVASGHVTSLESIDSPKKKSQKYLLTDDDHIYLICNTPDSDEPLYSENLAAIRVNGIIYAWNRETNRFAWPQPINMRQQNLVIDRFSQMPVLLLISRSTKPRGRGPFGSLNIAAIHKQSGKILLDNKNMPSAYSGFHAMSINHQEQTIDLKAYQLRIRLMPKNDQAAGGANAKSTDAL